MAAHAEAPPAVVSTGGAACVKRAYDDILASLHTLPGHDPAAVAAVEYFVAAFVAGHRHALDEWEAADRTGDPRDEALAAFHAGRHARARAADALRRAEAGASTPRDSAWDEGRRLLALAARLDWQARLPLVVAVAGVAGSNRSALAADLARASGYRVISSDVTRKAGAGLSPVRRGSVGLYDASHDRATYRRMAAAAALAAEAGEGVIVDASLRRRWQRDVLRDAIGDRPLVFVECTAPPAVLVARAVRRRRAHSISDSGPDVVARQLRDREPLDEVAPEQHVVVRTDGDLAAAATRVAHCIDDRWIHPPARRRT